MKKCTLCVDRIYNENIPEVDRVPACVKACPTGARFFGDLGDPDSEVSQIVKEREGYDLMPEFGFKPVNKYLPPRQQIHQKIEPESVTTQPENTVFNPTGATEKLFKWADRILSR